MAGTSLGMAAAVTDQGQSQLRLAVHLERLVIIEKEMYSLRDRMSDFLQRMSGTVPDPRQGVKDGAESSPAILHNMERALTAIGYTMDHISLIVGELEKIA